MPNQDMLDRMPEVSQKTLAEELGIPAMTLTERLSEQLEEQRQKADHSECQARVRSLSAIRAAQREEIKALEDEIELCPAVGHHTRRP